MNIVSRKISEKLILSSQPLYHEGFLIVKQPFSSVKGAALQCQRYASFSSQQMSTSISKWIRIVKAPWKWYSFPHVRFQFQGNLKWMLMPVIWEQDLRMRCRWGKRRSHRKSLREEGTSILYVFPLVLYILFNHYRTKCCLRSLDEAKQGKLAQRRRNGRRAWLH